MRPTGLGEGDSLKAGDDRCTLSTSLLPPFWIRVFCLLSLRLKTGDMELLCNSIVCFRVGKQEDSHELCVGFDTEESKLSDELPLSFRYGALESSDDF